MYLQIAIFLNNNENFFLHGRNNLLNTKVQFVLHERVILALYEGE